MILSDRDIKELDIIHPFISENLQPASYDLTLSDEFYYRNKHVITDSFKLDSHEFCLGSTVEHISIPQGYVGVIDGKSSLARIGLLVHITAGYIDPGFTGNITLEFFNCSHKPIELKKDMLIAQIRLHTLSSDTLRLYGDESLNSHYQNQSGVTRSWMEEEIVTKGLDERRRRLFTK